MGRTRIVIAPQRVYLVVWWLDDFGGMERHVTELAVALQGRGHQVSVFSESPVPLRNQYRRRLEAQGVRFWAPAVPRVLVFWLRRLKDSGHLEAAHWWLYQRLNLGSASSEPVAADAAGSVMGSWLKRAMEKAMTHGRPTVVHVHGFRLGQPWVVAWAAARQLPVVYTEHSTIGDWGGPYEPSAPAMVTQAGAIACVSEQSRQSLAHWLPEREIDVHGHIVPALPEAVQAPGATVRLLCVARLRLEKGIDVLLQAAAEASLGGQSFQIRIVGDGEDRQTLEDLRQRLGITSHVQFLGRLNADEIQVELRQADVFVLPSRTEALPVAVVEAMAAGLAIIASRTGGIPELVPDGAGILVTPGSVPELAAALAALITNAESRLQLQRAARDAFQASVHHEERAIEAVCHSYERAGCRCRE